MCMCHVQCVADVDKPDSIGNTALHVAVAGATAGSDVVCCVVMWYDLVMCMCDSDVYVTCCVQCAADVDKPDSSGNTALHVAVAGGRLGIAALLVAAGADADLENCGLDESSDLSADSSNDDDYSDDEQTDGPTESTTDETERTGKTARQLAAGDDKVW